MANSALFRSLAGALIPPTDGRNEKGAPGSRSDDRVVDSPRMLRIFVQIVRSGATGRKSLGAAPNGDHWVRENESVMN